MMKQMCWLLIFGITMLALLMAIVPVAWADDDDDDEDEIPFDVANIFFELNNTDGDLGIHALIDGEPWRKLTIEDQKEIEILNIHVTARLRRQGLTGMALP